MKKLFSLFFCILYVLNASFSQDSIKYILVKNINNKKSGSYDESSYPLSLTVANDKLYFVAIGDSVGQELFISDGTTEGTKLLKNINSYHQVVSSESDNSSSPSGLTVFGDKIIFGANDDIYGYEPWVSDGTTNGTFMLRDILTENLGSNAGSGPGSFVLYNDRMFFMSSTWSGRHLFITDGTSQGTTMVKEVVSSTTYGGDFKIFQNKLYYNYSDYLYNNNELWSSDGTESGTNIFKDICTPNGGSEPSGFFEFNNKLYFTAMVDSIGRELFVTDGTSQNTILFKDINQQQGCGSAAQQFIILNSTLFFTAADSVHGIELWRTNGDSISMVKDICEECGALSYSKLHIYNNRLYFKAKASEQSNNTLWTSDGTADGTYEILSFDSTSVVEPESFVNWRGKLIFKAKKQNTLNTQLWITDGTIENTKQIFPDSITGWNSIGESELVLFKNEVYFSASYIDTIGVELYKLIIDTTSLSISSTMESSSMNNLVVKPNPVSDFFQVELEKDVNLNEIRLFDINGRVIYFKKSNSYKETIDVTGIPNGFYILSVKNSNGVFSKKIIKTQ